MLFNQKAFKIEIILLLGRLQNSQIYEEVGKIL